MFGNPKYEVVVCHKCKKKHDIQRGTRIFCECGEEIKSKEYVGQKDDGEKDEKMDNKEWAILILFCLGLFFFILSVFFFDNINLQGTFIGIGFIFFMSSAVVNYVVARKKE